MSELDLARAYYAEELRAVANLQAVFGTREIRSGKLENDSTWLAVKADWARLTTTKRSPFTMVPFTHLITSEI